MTHVASDIQPPALVELPGREGCLVVSVPGSAASAIRSFGWELHCLGRAVRLLSARVKNETLSPALIKFLSPVLPEVQGAPESGITGQRHRQRMMVQGSSVKVSWDALEENSVSAIVLALLHLPGLRSFWERTLRRSHFGRLCRELPRAWFVTTDLPPVGAVVPGLGITSWDEPLRGGPFVRVSGSAGDVMIEDVRMEDAVQIVAHYEQSDGRVVLRAAE